MAESNVQFRSDMTVELIKATASDADRLTQLSSQMRAEVVAYAEARREVEALL